jgi:hypothetical protein
MVIKKKRTYKKQRGGITQIDRIMIPFFNIINKLICICSIFINTVVITNANGNKLNQIDIIIENLNIFINKNIKYSLFINMITNINKFIQTIQNIQDIKIIIKNILEIVIESLLSNFIQKLKLFDKFLKIYIHILFIEYLFNQNNVIFKGIFMELLKNPIFNNNSTYSKYYIIIKPNKEDNIAELYQKLRNLFLNDYSIEYRGIPVFYGGLLFDSQYNEYVCRQIGASSTKKRNFIINPVLAFAYSLFYKLITKNDKIKRTLEEIDRLPKINQSSEQLKKNIEYYETFNKLIKELFKNLPYIFALISFVIQNFNSKRENNSIILRRLHLRVIQTPEQTIRDGYSYLYSKVHVPKLSHVSPNSPFCIVLNEFGAEEVIQPSTFSKCAWTYGCNLKMTPVIRDENISSMHDILSLAQILFIIVLTHGDNIFMDVISQSDFLVEQYIDQFYKKLDGQRNNRNMNSIRIRLNEYQIRTLLKTLSFKYKDLLIEKIINESQRQNTSEIDEKLKMIRDELTKFKGLDYLYNFLLNEKDNICKNNNSTRTNGFKLHIFGEELYKIQQLQLFSKKV